eukprot:9191514-Prorocentrum_lima.AAC.1
MDIACEKTCSGIDWLQQQLELVHKKARLKVAISKEQEYFKFGAGETQLSKVRARLPSAVA